MGYPRKWIGIEIPGFRDSDHTYTAWDLNSLPSVPATDDELSWLRSQPASSSLGYSGPHEWRSEIDFYDRSARTVDDLPTFVEARGYHLPITYLTFISDIELVSRFRSPTGCGFYFPYMGVGNDDQLFVDLMADYQGCYSWYLHLTPNGNSVVASPESIHDTDTMDHSFVVQCADSFGEFLIRWYIECELWWRLRENSPAMSSEMLHYLDHYRAG